MVVGVKNNPFENVPSHVTKDRIDLLIRDSKSVELNMIVSSVTIGIIAEIGTLTVASLLVASVIALPAFSMGATVVLVLGLFILSPVLALIPAFLTFCAMSGVASLVDRAKNGVFKPDVTFLPQISSKDLVKALTFLKSYYRHELMNEMSLQELCLAFLANKPQFIEDLNTLPDHHSPAISKIKMITALTSVKNKEEFLKKVENWNLKNEDALFIQVVLHQAQQIENLADRLLIARYFQKQLQGALDGEEIIDLHLKNKVKLKDNAEKGVEIVRISKNLLMENGEFLKSVLRDVSLEELQQYPFEMEVRNVTAAKKLLSILTEETVTINSNGNKVLEFAHQYAERFFHFAKMVLSEKELKSLAIQPSQL